MNYRTLWIKHNGDIPLDENGRSYEIHHIDGDSSNNSLENLMCVSIEEHFKIHFEQGDYQAAALIAGRIEGLNPKEISALVLKEKKNPWQKENRNGPLGNEFTSKTASKMAKERASKGLLPGQVNAKAGKHHWQTEEHSNKIAESNKRFRNTVTVTDKNGKSKRIEKEMFEKQKIGQRTKWDYVGVSSKEAKKRRGEI